MTKWNFKLSWVEHEKSIIISGPGLRSVNRNIRGYSQNKSKLSVELWQFSAEGCEHPRTILKLSFSTAKMADKTNKIYVCSLLTKVW